MKVHVKLKGETALLISPEGGVMMVVNAERLRRRMPNRNEAVFDATIENGILELGEHCYS